MKHRYTVGVLIGNANSAYATDLMQGMIHAAETAGVNLLLYLGIHSAAYRTSFDRDKKDDYEYQFNVVYDYAGISNVDALIISYGTLSHYLERRKMEEFLNRCAAIPCVMVEEEDESGQRSSVIGENYEGMTSLLQHLIKEHNYKSFLYLSGPAGIKDADQRRAAFMDVMRSHHLPLDETRIAYGDYTAYVEKQVCQLLDAHPDADVIVCANDMMADAVYQVCQKRGITVGKDLAVTGYDDWKNSQYMNPPLTTVFQNAYNMGYTALYGAIGLCEGKAPRRYCIPAVLKRRSSCGCVKAKAEIEWEKHTRILRADGTSPGEAEYFLNKIFIANSNDSMKERVAAIVNRFLALDFENWKIIDQATVVISEFLDKSVQPFISLQALWQEVNRHLDSLIMHNSTDEGEEYAIWQQLILDLKNEIHALITANIVKSAQESFEGFVQATWCLPLISREMLNYLEDEQEFFRIAMERMTAFHIKQSYLFIFEQPVPHKKDAAWEFTQKLYLAAFQVGKQVTSYKREDRPCVNDTEGLAKFWKGEGPFCMQVYVLFSGEMQYGIMVTETSIGNIPLAYLASMQISNSLRFLEMSVIQRRTREKLEKLVEEINEKNEVLNFISEYDVLTDCLNRRGFMEAAMRLNKEHRGESASLIFMDVDHLKEINDTFGHKEGDFAIQRTASVLMEAVGGSGIVGRIGGDEFVAMILEEEGRTEEILKSVRESNQLFNAHSQKEYYIEASTGVRFFVCNENLMLSEILDAADMELYQSKKLRRKTIRKVAI